MVTEGKICIWKSVTIGDYIGVQTCLELNGIPVWLKNETISAVMSGESVSGTELWIVETEFQPAIELLFEGGLINEIDYQEAKTGKPNIPEKSGFRFQPIHAFFIFVFLIALLAFFLFI